MTAGAVGTRAVPAAAQGDLVQTEVHSPLAALLCGMVLLLILCNEHILAKNPQSDCLLPAGAGTALPGAGEVAPGRRGAIPTHGLQEHLGGTGLQGSHLLGCYCLRMRDFLLLISCIRGKGCQGTYSPLQACCKLPSASSVW